MPVDSLEVFIDGTRLSQGYEIISVDVECEVNRIPTASVVVGVVGTVDEQTRLLGGEGPFTPGAAVRININKHLVFNGLVTGLSVRTPEELPVLQVSLKEKAIRLAGPRQNRIFSDKTDAEAIRAIINLYGLELTELPETKPLYKTLVQYDSTDWDFVVARADAQGLVVIVHDGALSLKDMQVSGPATRRFSLGEPLANITGFQFDLDLTHQYPAVKALAWDPTDLGPTEARAAQMMPPSQGGKESRQDPLTFGTEQLIHMVPMPMDESTRWADGRMARERLALVRGRIGTGGIPDLALMEVATLSGFGNRFDGEALITGFRHRLDARGFSTDIQVGLPPEPFGQMPDIADVPARGLLPPITGLQLGRVTSAEADPDGEARVKIRVATIATDPPQDLWARIATPDAGKQHGFCFFPEVDDEVVVSFLDNDPRYPVVLGRLHGSKYPPPEGFSDNNKKGIVTKSGVKISFVEAEKPAITIETKGGRKLTLDDDGAAVTLADQIGNSVSFDQSGVTIKSAKDLKIEARGAIKIKGLTIDLN